MNSNHYMQRLARAATTLLLLVTSATAWAQNEPTAILEVVAGLHGSIHVKGWCEDPDAPGTPLSVNIWVKDSNDQPVAGYNPITLTANLQRNGEDNQWHYNGFDQYLPITTAGTYKVDVMCNDATNDASPIFLRSGIEVAAPYTVTYNANGGTGAPASQLKHENVPLTLSSTVPTRDGHNFLSWDTAAGGGGTVYSPGATCTANADATLYAQWVASDFPGSGTAADPYVISTAGQWNLFANNVNNGNTYSGKYFVLGADITVSTMAGTNDSPFSGTFSGNGHTMNLAINGTGTGGGHPNLAVAPFRYVSGATFTNLNLTGYVTREDYPGDANVSVGGLIGVMTNYRSVTITGCRSNVTANYNFTWDSNDFKTGHIGGFIGWCEAGNVTITDCLFDGTFHGRPNYQGGFIGRLLWGKATFNNCLMSGTSYASPTYSGTFFGRDNNGGDGSLNNCYYTNSFGGNQGTSTSATGETLRALLGNGWVVSGSAVVPGKVLTLSATADNTAAIAAAAIAGTACDRVVLNDYTLYRDGTWNTIVLPFNLATLTGTPLAGATVKTLASSAYTTQNGGTLTLTFADATSIEAGKPYIVKWSSGSNIVNPVFTDVTISSAAANVSTTYADFLGSYAPISTGLLDAHNTDGSAMHAAISTATPGKTGYTFAGWYTDAARQTAVTTIPFAADGSVTLYAKWTLNTYTITYDLAGGSVATANPATYTFESDAITLNNPTRDGYAFAGWTGTDLDEPAMTVTIPAGSMGNRTYTATWIKGGIAYRAYNTTTQTFETRIATNWNSVTSSTYYIDLGTANTETWYIVDEDVAVSGPICVYGTVHLILCDGKTLTTGGGVEVDEGNNFIVYGQSGGTGALTANSDYATHAGIGGFNAPNGAITIHGGNITATGGSDSAGIGGGNNRNGSTITIYGGTISATGGDDGAGIGGGDYNGNGGTVIITGGTINATGGKNASGIGGGRQGVGGTITITGGTVTATGGTEAIGHGSKKTDSGSLTLGNMKVYASADATTPVAAANRVSTCRGLYAKLMPCTEHNMENDICTWCGYALYHVTYDGNGATSGTVPTDATDYESGQTVIVLGNTDYLERTGYTFDGWNTQADGLGTDYAPGATFAISSSVTLYAKWEVRQLELANNADNGDAIGLAAGDDMYYDVTLADRTLYKDGDWNTLCLPFDVDDFTGTPLEGATVKTLTSSDFAGGTLTMNFSGNLNSIDAGVPYIVKWNDDADLVIRSAADWNTFATNVNNGTESYQGKKVKLGADISVSTMVGTVSGSTQGNAFCGTFDGCGHTLNVSITDTGNQGTAPFRYISGAIIKNLKTTGTVTGNLHCAGLVGFAADNTTNIIQNCEVAVSVVCSGGNHSHCGGILGHGLSSTTTVRDCLFSGTISGATTATGIIYGWGQKTSTHTIINCLAAGTYTNCSGVDMIIKDRGTIVATNCYKKQNVGSYGTYTTATGSDLQALLGSGWEVSGGNVVPKMSSNIENPVFSGVTISNTPAAAETEESEWVDFVGTYSPVGIYESGDDKHNLYLGSGNNIYYPTREGYTVKACRAYFRLKDSLTAGDPADPQQANVRAFVLDFGDGEETAIRSLTPDASPNGEGRSGWFTLDGRRLSAKPTASGIYINNGKKVVIK